VIRVPLRKSSTLLHKHPVHSGWRKYRPETTSGRALP
jgi:hypothetical protein